MTNAFYFYRKDLGDGLKYLGILERVGETDYRFTYCENPALLVGSVCGGKSRRAPCNHRGHQI